MPYRWTSYLIFSLAFFCGAAAFAQNALKLTPGDFQNARNMKPRDYEQWLLPDVGATLDEYFAFYERLTQRKNPATKSATEAAANIRYYAELSERLADKLLAFGDDLNDERYRKASTLKTSALKTQALYDPNKRKELVDHVANMLLFATNEERALTAFFLQYDAIVFLNPKPEEVVRKLSDTALRYPSEKVKRFGLLVRYPFGRLHMPEFLGLQLPTRQLDMSAIDEELAFYETMASDSAYPTSLRETASLAKLAILNSQYIASKNAAEQDEDEIARRAKAFDETFSSCVEPERALETRRFAYRVCLFQKPLYAPEDEAKTARQEAAIALLEQEDAPELKLLLADFRVHQLVLKALAYLRDAELDGKKDALAPPETLAQELDDYAKQVQELVAEDSPFRAPFSAVLDGYAHILRNDLDAVFTATDAALGDYSRASAPESIDLTTLRVFAISKALRRDVDCYAKHEPFVAALLADARTSRLAETLLVVKTCETFKKLADEGADRERFARALETFKTDATRAPLAAAGFYQSRKAITKLGTSWNEPDLFEATLNDLIDLFDGSDGKAAVAAAFFRQLRAKTEQELQKEPDLLEESLNELL